MSKSKLRLDITCLKPRQRRRIFLKKLQNISQMTINSNLKVQNDVISESNEPDNIEQLSQSQTQNVLNEINFNYSNVTNIHNFTVNNGDLISELSEISIDKNSLQSSVSCDEFFDKTDIINDIRLWVIENCISHFAVSNLLKILIKYGHDLPMFELCFKLSNK